ncbi:MAG: transcription elongation factor GreA [Anaplasmataceae bacterium]|nr:transcription elongation factor GreA [Anaplasmataceae bacterium]
MFKPITSFGKKKLQDEMDSLIQLRPKISATIGTAADNGDLSENADYHAAKDWQGDNERKIAILSKKLSEVYIPEIESDNNTVKFGFFVEIQDFDDDNSAIKKYRIVGEYESDIDNGDLSITSPLGRSLLNKKVGDFAEVNTPSGDKIYKILKISIDK